MMRQFVFRWMITMGAVMIAPVLISGTRYDTGGALIGAALFLGILNAFVRPVLLILSAPLIASFRGSDGRVHVLIHHLQIRCVERRITELTESRGR